MREKGVQVSATIPTEWDNVLEEHKWDVRKTKTNVVKTAIQEYLVNHGLIPDPEGIIDDTERDPAD